MEWGFCVCSRVAQWERAGPITQRSMDRNHPLLDFFSPQGNSNKTDAGTLFAGCFRSMCVLQIVRYVRIHCK